MICLKLTRTCCVFHTQTDAHTREGPGPSRERLGECQCDSVMTASRVEQNVMTHKTIVEYGMASTLLWGWVTGRPSRGCPLLPPLSLCLFPLISTSAFLFMPARLFSAQGYWFCLNLSERSSTGFLVIPAFLASSIYLQKTQAPRQSSTFRVSQCKSHVQTTQYLSHGDRPEELLETLVFSTFPSPPAAKELR